jgi:hypothetical protein
MPVAPEELTPFLVSLFASTLIYNFIIGLLESIVKEPHPLTAWWVVCGVMIVLVFFLLAFNSVVLTGYQAFIYLLLFFAVGGLPMILGSHWRADTKAKV